MRLLRRSVLSAFVSAVPAIGSGCSSDGTVGHEDVSPSETATTAPPNPTGGLSLENYSNVVITVEVEIVESATREVVFDKSVELESSGDGGNDHMEGYSDAFPEPGGYKISVTTDRGHAESTGVAFNRRQWRYLSVTFTDSDVEIIPVAA